MVFYGNCPTILVWQSAPAAAAKSADAFSKLCKKRFGNGNVTLLNFVKTKKPSLIYEDGCRRDAIFSAAEEDADAILRAAKEKKNTIIRMSDVSEKELKRIYGTTAVG